MSTAEIDAGAVRGSAERLSFVWLEITGLCQLECAHCYAASSPAGDHGAMCVEDWLRVIDDAAVLGVGVVQFIGGGATRGRVWRVDSQIGDD